MHFSLSLSLSLFLSLSLVYYSSASRGRLRRRQENSNHSYGSVRDYRPLLVAGVWQARNQATAFISSETRVEPRPGRIMSGVGSNWPISHAARIADPESPRAAAYHAHAGNPLMGAGWRG